MSRKVLIVTYYWPPSGGPGVQRYLKFARYLPEFGIEPVVLTVENPTYPTRDPTLAREIPTDLKIYSTRTVEPFGLYAGLSGKKAESIKPTVELKGRTFKSRVGSWIRANIFIPDARAGWLLTARGKADELVLKHSIETVITTGPPHSVHFVGKYMKTRQGLRWLADFRDPWSSIHYNQLLPRTRLAERVDETLEKSILQLADEVIVVSRKQAEEFGKIYDRTYRVITNGFDPGDFKVVETEMARDRSTPSGPNKPLLVRHVGSIGEASIPEALLKALKDHITPGSVRLEFVGEVHSKLPGLVEKMGLTDHVAFEGYQPHQKALQRMCDADALLLSIPNVDEALNIIPGKLFEYLASGRPILLIGPNDGESARIIREEEAGLVAPFGDAAAVAQALEALIEGKVQPRPIVTQKDHPYSRHTLTRQLAQLISGESIRSAVTSRTS